MSDSHVKLRAVMLSTLLVFSGLVAPTPVVAASGNSATVSVANTPATSVGNSYSANIDYDADGVVASGNDLGVGMVGIDTTGNYQTLSYKQELSSTSGSTTLSVPSQKAPTTGGDFRAEVQFVDFTDSQNPSLLDTATTTVSVNSPVGIAGVANMPTEIEQGETFSVEVTLENTDQNSGHDYTVRIYPESESYQPIGQQTVTVDAGNTKTVTVSATVSNTMPTGETQIAINGQTPTTVSVIDGSGPSDVPTTVQSWAISGPGDETSLETHVTQPGGQGGLLQVDLWNKNPSGDWPQNLDGTGVTEETAVQFAIEVDKSYKPAVVVATAQDVSWTRTQQEDGDYLVTVTAKPLESQNIEGVGAGPWPTEDDQATVAFKPMFSIAFVSESMMGNSNLDGTVMATDAQNFGTPQYTSSGPNGEPSLDIYVAGPHLTVDGSQNEGQYEAFLPQALLDQWGVTSPETDLVADYQSQDIDSNQMTVDSSVQGGVKVSFPIHYSEGTVSLSATDESSSGGSTDDSSTGSPSTGSPSTDTSTTDDTTDDVADPVVEGVTARETVALTDSTTEDGGPNATFENLSVSEISFGNTTNATNATSSNGTVTVDELEALPETLEHDEGEVVSAVNITVPAELEDSEATVQFSVNASDVNDTANLKLLRFTDDGYEVYNATAVSESNGTLTLEATVPGFSVFAVVEGDDAPQSQETNSTSNDETTAEPTATTVEPTATSTAEPADTTTSTSEPTETTSPGFGVTVTLVALLAAALLVGRRQ